jgi:hypothetical protein
MVIAKIAMIAKDRRNSLSLLEKLSWCDFQFWQFLPIPAILAIQVDFTLLSNVR